MADSLNLSDLESLFSPDRKPLFVGKPEGWWERTGVPMAENYAFVADNDCRGLVRCVLELQRDDYWRQHCSDWDEFCQQVFHRPAAWIEQVVEGVRLLHIRGERGKVGAGQALAAQASQAQPLAAHRRPTAEEQEGKGSVTTFKDRGQSYLLRRLARDRPDILERVKSGEFKSARAAAIEAGIIKPVPTVRLMDDAAKAAAAILKKMGPEWCQQLVASLACQLPAAS